MQFYLIAIKVENYRFGFRFCDYVFPMSMSNSCQDYENETNWRTKVPQENCGEFAINEPGKKSICKVEPSELFRVTRYLLMSQFSTDLHTPSPGKLHQGKPLWLQGGPPLHPPQAQQDHWLGAWGAWRQVLAWGHPRAHRWRYQEEQWGGKGEICEWNDVKDWFSFHQRKSQTRLGQSCKLYCLQNERVWIDCQGENPADRENLGPVIYHPTNGISKNYFPYRNQEGYLSPAIFVEFTQVKCKWENGHIMCD